MSETALGDPIIAVAKPHRRAALPAASRDGLVMIAITLVLFLLIEGGIRLIAPQDVRTTYISGGALAVPDPVLGHINLPGAHARIDAPEFSVDYRISPQGFRDEEIHSPIKPAGTTRVLVLGDSFAQGSGNRYQDIWPVLTENALRRQGRKVELIKAGVFGYDTRQELLYLERLYDKYRPDIVVITMVLHDVFTNAPLAAAPGFEPAVERLTDKKSQLHSLILARRLLMANDALYSRLYLTSERRSWFAMPQTQAVRRQMDVTRGLFGRAASFCHEKGCDLVVLSIPQLFQLIAADPARRRANIDPFAIDAQLGRFAAQQGFTWVPMLPALARLYATRRRDLYYRFDGHLNAEGNRVAAQIATSALAARIKASPPAIRGRKAA